MFENLSLLELQQYWWIMVSLLAGLLIFLMFVQGGQTLIPFVAKNADERSLLINSLGRKWEFTFTTLVTFGGAVFAAFPLFYATSFGGAYWVWMLILFSFIIQAVSYEFRSKAKNFLGQKTYDVFLFINGCLAPILIGTAVGTFFTGSAFIISDYNSSTWMHSMRGLEATLNFDNVSLGLAAFFLVRILGALYFMNAVDHQEILKRSVKQIKINTIIFLIFFLYFLFRLLFMDGYNYDAVTKAVSLQEYKYLNNFIDLWLVSLLFIIGVLGVLYGIILALFFKSCKGIWFSGIGSVLAIFALFMIAGLNNTCFYPSIYNIKSSLTIENASSSHYTLTAMSYVSLFIPFVLAYIYFAWKVMNKKKINTEELKNEEHTY